MENRWQFLAQHQAKVGRMSFGLFKATFHSILKQRPRVTCPLCFKLPLVRTFSSLKSELLDIPDYDWILNVNCLTSANWLSYVICARLSRLNSSSSLIKYPYLSGLTCDTTEYIHAAQAMKISKSFTTFRLMFKPLLLDLSTCQIGRLLSTMGNRRQLRATLPVNGKLCVFSWSDARDISCQSICFMTSSTHTHYRTSHASKDQT